MANLTAEQVARHIAWFLSNSNHEIQTDTEFLDVAFNSGSEGSTVTVGVDTWNAETREGGNQVFKFTLVQQD